VQQSKSENTYPDRSDNGCKDEHYCYPSRRHSFLRSPITAQTQWRIVKRHNIANLS